MLMLSAGRAAPLVARVRVHLDPSWPFFSRFRLVYLCYVDESGDPGPRGSTHLVLTGAAVFEGKWSYLLRDLELLVAKYWPTPPRPTEIHLAEMRSRQGAFRRLTRPQRTALETDLCALVNGLLSTELRVFAVVADKAWWFARNTGKTGDDLYVALFEELSSRFDLYLRRRHAEGAPSKGIIIADPHKDQMSRALQDHQRASQANGNRWSQIYNLVETVFFLGSHESPGLQIADLFSYAVWRLVTAGDTHLAATLADCFDREPMTSTRNPGKWHGIKYLGDEAVLGARLRTVWA